MVTAVVLGSTRMSHSNMHVGSRLSSQSGATNQLNFQPVKYTGRILWSVRLFLFITYSTHSLSLYPTIPQCGQQSYQEHHYVRLGTPPTTASHPSVPTDTYRCPPLLSWCLWQRRAISLKECSHWHVDVVQSPYRQSISQSLKLVVVFQPFCHSWCSTNNQPSRI